MDEIQTKTCANCKRDIPDVNFTTHSLHCVRNIRLCPVCKEPVPIENLKEHQESLHKLLPCTQCGEDICGSDLEDHVRDSCGLTASACHYCDLELPRRDMPPHELYCGSRTQLCECGELVMFKYKQLHEQTQHGFIKLDDEPGPEPSWKKFEAKDKPKPNQSTAVPSHSVSTNQKSDETTNRPSTSNMTNMFSVLPGQYDNRPINLNNHDRVEHMVEPQSPVLNVNHRAGRSEEKRDNLSIDLNNPDRADRLVEPQSPVRNINHEPGRSAKRTNDMPQLNMAIQDKSKVKKDLRSNGSTKKRPAPPPPVEQQPTSCTNQDFNELLQFSQMGVAGAPMSASDFEERFAQLRVQGAPVPPVSADRFTDIKRELRELRRGLNEVTAPYNTPAVRESEAPPAPPQTAAPRTQFRLLDYMHPPPGYFAQSPTRDSLTDPDTYDTSQRQQEMEGDFELSGNNWTTCRIPCEFCGAPLLPEDLIQHSTGCRPDLTRVRTPPSPPPSVPATDDESLIPCEFCARPCPIHQLMDHQTVCRHA